MSISIQQTPAKMQSMPEEMYSQFFSFLNPTEVASIESVQSSWRSMINSEDSQVWKDQCRIQGVSTASTRADVEDSLKDVLGSYSSKNVDCSMMNPDIISTISDYDSYDHPLVNYKTSCSAIQGKVIIRDNSQINPLVKGTDYLPLRWSSGRNPEAFVSTLTYSDESLAACQDQHILGDAECDLGQQGSWQDIHPRLPNFPSRLPLRLFFNPDGSYKKTGDQIKLRHLNHPVVLTCASSVDKAKTTSLDLFKATLIENVNRSVKNGVILGGYIQDACATATDGWVSSD